jgi:sugar/nucleoside kinase (ribokinase family)
MDFNRRNVIVGVGSALVDILARESDDFLQRTGAVKGGMVYVDPAQIERTLSMASSVPRIVPGGSACNTVVGISQLGGAARFVGRCGQGAMGNFFENALRTRRVDPKLSRSNTPTGRVLSIVTPDAERSMFTFLGAAAETRPEDLRQDYFSDAAVVHIEGYLLFNPELILAALRAARSAGAAVSLDLASFNVVAQAREFLADVVREHVDILIANEEEARAYTGSSERRQMIEDLGRDVRIAALKLGPQGSWITADGQVVRVTAQGDGGAVDTTGAGDLWASGFLYGLVAGYSLAESGAIGSACGYEVCQVMGASIPEEGWQRIKKRLQTPDRSNLASPGPATGEAAAPLQPQTDGLPANEGQGGQRRTMWRQR